MKKIKGLFLAVTIAMSTMCISVATNAEIINEPDCMIMYKSGKYIYYLSEKETSNEIIKYNVKTHKKKIFMTSKIKEYDTDGFSSIAGKGKYIYFSWNKAEKNKMYEKEYIYRVTKDGKNLTKLAAGRNVVIKANRIYYLRNKLITNKSSKETQHTQKVYSMKLDGSDKRKENNVRIQAKSGGGYYLGTIRTVTKGKYIYGMDMNGFYITDRERDKRKKIVAFSEKERCVDFFVSKDYVMFRKFKNNYLYAYIMKANGKDLRVIYKVRD